MCVFLAHSIHNETAATMRIDELRTSAGKHVVFGSVTKGMDVVKKIEGFGSQSGKTSKPIVIADCGQLK